jgi:hypothetical protein
MTLLNRMRFELLNRLTEEEVMRSRYLIYAHKCIQGVYIGFASDPVKRWQEHFADAHNPCSVYANDLFKKALRGFPQGFKHYIIAAARTEEEARNKEAAAIRFYKATLNIRNEYGAGDANFNYQPISAQIGKPIFLTKSSKNKNVHRHSEEERIWVVGEIYTEQGRKRVRVIAGQPFSKGLNIECSREERANYEDGQKVRVKVSLASKKGTNYLVAGADSKLNPVD